MVITSVKDSSKYSSNKSWNVSLKIRSPNRDQLRRLPVYAAGVLHIAGAGVRRSEPLRGRVGRGHRVTVRRAERVHDDDLRAGPDGADIRWRRLPGGVRGHRLPGDLCVPAELASAQPAPLVDTM